MAAWNTNHYKNKELFLAFSLYTTAIKHKCVIPLAFSCHLIQAVEILDCCSNSNLYKSSKNASQRWMDGHHFWTDKSMRLCFCPSATLILLSVTLNDFQSGCLDCKETETGVNSWLQANWVSPDPHFTLNGDTRSPGGECHCSDV